MFRATRASRHGVAGGIMRAEVGLGFDDARMPYTAIVVMHLETHAEQFTRDEGGIAIVEVARQCSGHTGKMMPRTTIVRATGGR
jgi:hypothetical protein